VALANEVKIHSAQYGCRLLPPYELRLIGLLADWQLAVNGKKPFPIRGLDQ
jgi:hypothetical protein